MIISRLTLLTNNKRYKQISYLNGFHQIFIENLSRKALDMGNVPVQGGQILQDYPEIFNFDEIIQRLFDKVVKRFDFTIQINESPEIIKEFSDILNSMSENNIFN